MQKENPRRSLIASYIVINSQFPSPMISYRGTPIVTRQYTERIETATAAREKPSRPGRPASNQPCWSPTWNQTPCAVPYQSTPG